MIYKKRTVFKTTAALRRAAYNSPETLTSLSEAIGMKVSNVSRNLRPQARYGKTVAGRFDLLAAKLGVAGPGAELAK